MQCGDAIVLRRFCVGAGCVLLRCEIEHFRRNLLTVDYKLLTPGPLTTTDSVKREMLVDHCTWDDDYKSITRDIRARLLEVADVCDQKYTSVLMQGSGTFGVEALLSTVLADSNKLLVATNGAYGLRLTEIAKRHGIDVVSYDEDFANPLSAAVIDHMLTADPSITTLAVVHCETTTGLMNDIKALGEVAKKHGVLFIVDAMSSFGGVKIDMEETGIDYLVSSANKCIQGVPGFSFAIARRDLLEQCAGRARTLSLDLYDQWKGMEADGKWRYTSPTHVVLAFAQALRELEEEGGVAAREARYSGSQELLVRRMKEIGFKPYIDEDYHSPVITTFLYPYSNGQSKKFCFQDMYDFLKSGGFVIYPGKLTEVDTFRVGNIGEIYEDDINELCDLFADYLLTR